MKSRFIYLIFNLLSIVNTFAQNQLFKGDNLLMPSNLIVGYPIDMDTCYDLVNGPIRISSTRNIIENKPVKDLFGIILKPVLEGKVDAYNLNPWMSYQLMEEKKKVSSYDIIENLGNPETNEYDIKELKAIKFVEEWKLTSKPFSFEKEVIAYSPVRCYIKQTDSVNFYKHFKIPFTIVDTMKDTIEISRSNQRMQLVNEIAHEYLLYANFLPPFNVVKSINEYDSISGNLNAYLLNREASEYLSSTATKSLMHILIDKIIKGELKAFNINTNQELTTEDVKWQMGYSKVTIESGSVSDMHYMDVVTEMNFNAIKSIIFFEKWYIDPVSLRMKKKVFALAPVFHYYDYGNERYLRKILFKIYFTEK